MTNDKEAMIVCPHENGGYVVRPMSWAGVWNKDGKLKSTCRFTAFFVEKADAYEYCRICNDISTFSILSLREELLKHGAVWDAFVASITSALEDEVLPYEPDEELAEKVLRRVIGEDDRPRNFDRKFTFSCDFQATDALQELFNDANEGMSTVDITGYSSKIILQILSDFDEHIKTLVTTDQQHYKMLQTLSAFEGEPFGYNKLYGKILIYDPDEHVPAAKIEFRKKGGETDYDN